jgi:hypothetical protein
MMASVHALGTWEHQLQLLHMEHSVQSGLGTLILGTSHSLPTGTFANIFRRELGSREVVIMTLGSSTPAHRYSSSTWLVTPVRSMRNKKVTLSYELNANREQPSWPEETLMTEMHHTHNS